MKQLKLALAPLFTTYRYQTALVYALINPVLWAMFLIISVPIGQFVSFGMLFPNTISYCLFQLAWPIMAVILVKSQKLRHTEHNLMTRKKILKLSYIQLSVLIIWVAYLLTIFGLKLYISTLVL